MKSPHVLRRISYPRSNVKKQLGLIMVILLGMHGTLTKAATLYWDTSAGASNGIGGSATWGTTFSSNATGSAALSTAATTDNLIFDGTAGTVTLAANQTAASLTFNANNYTLTPDATARVLTGPITLAASVNLNLNDSAATTNRTLSLASSLSGGTGSTITIQGAQASGAASRVNLSASGVNIGVPITINGSSTGVAGIAATATNTSLSGVITNNSTARTSIGATSGNSITVNGKVTGSAGLQFSAGDNGGAGTITMNASSDYTGATTFNAASGAIIKLGIDNALPTGTNVTMAATASNGGILDLNGRNQEIASLTSGAGGGSITNNGSSDATLKISGSTSPAAFGLAITDGAKKISLDKSGTGTLTFSSTTNSYSGGTSINGGTLAVTGSLTGTGAVTLTNSNSTLSTGATTTIGGAITANNGTIITIGGSGAVGTLTAGPLTLNGGSTLNFDLLGSSNYDKINTTGALTLGTGTETINLAGSGFTAGNYTLLSGYTSLAGSGAFALGSTPGGYTYSLATGSTSTVLTVASLGGSGNLTWSLGGLAPTSSTDGVGTWTNGSSNFYNTGTSAAMTWDNTATNNLTVGSGGTGGTITLGGNVRVGGTITLAAVSSPYTIGTSGGTNTLTLVGGATANNSATINAPTVLEASQSWTIDTSKILTTNGAISETGGARALTKDGAGTLVLTSANNTYSGGTTVSSGTLSIASGSSAGSGNMTVSSGATLAGAGTVNGTTSVTSGTIDGSGLTLTGATTFSSTSNAVNGTVTATGGTILNANAATTVNGTLTVAGAAVAATTGGSNTTLTNLGTINQTGTGRGVLNTGTSGVVITNGSSTNATALIQTADADAVRSGVGGITLNNYGTLTSLNASAGGSQAVDFNPITTGSNIINNYATGVMQASEADAVRPGVNGVVNNDGLIKSTTSIGSGSDGIDAQTNTGITITNAAGAGGGTVTGAIDGARHGITGGNITGSGAYTMSITNNLGGTIKGSNGAGINIDGINANEIVTVINHGLITGNGVTGDGDGVDVDGLVNLTNTGTIRSINAFSSIVGAPAQSEGLSVGGGTIINSGTIEGLVASGNTNAVGRGISLLGNDITTGPLAGTREAIYANATVTNQSGGLIRGDSDSAIAVGGPASGYTVTINNNAGATLQGGGSTNAAVRTGADNDTINNAGTINGSSSGKAIDMGAGNNTLSVTGGTILGDIDGGAGGTNTATFTPGLGNTFSYAGSLSNFNSVVISTGKVLLSGASFYNGDTTINGTLNVNNTSGSATGAGSVIVNSGGTLGGNGSVGNVTLATGGTIAPGLSPGTLNIDGSLSIMDGSRFAFELGSISDLLNIGGAFNFTVGGTAIFDITDTGSMYSGASYTLMNYASVSGLSLSKLAFGTTPPIFTAHFNIGAKALTLQVDAIPEPSRALLAGLGLAFIALRRRRRK